MSERIRTGRGVDGGARQVHTAYCSACDREVRVLAPRDYRDREEPGAHDIGALVCLDHGQGCTGAFCPFSDAHPPPDTT